MSSIGRGGLSSQYDSTLDLIASTLNQSTQRFHWQGNDTLAWAGLQSYM